MKFFKTSALRILCIVLSLSFLSIGAFAVGESDMTTKTVYGHTYVYWSTLGDGISGSLAVYSTICTDDGNKVPEGYMGARARLYTSSGVLVSSSDWEYNSLSTSGKTAYYSYPCTSGYYYAKGSVKIYNGDGYNTYDCKATPNITPKAARDALHVNSSGELLGSELFLNELGIQPDLILAEGIDGTVGYVRNEDINCDTVSTLESAIAHGSGSTYFIPLYAEDGYTVIGQFRVGM